MAQEFTATPYHSFKDPDFGAKDYAAQWSDNLGWFDSRIVRRGLLSDRPAPAESGRIWITTDSGEETVYLDSGSQWIAVAGKKVSGGTVERDEVQIADGSTTDPKLTFQADTDTGLYRVGADTLGVTTGGTKAAEFTPDGNLALPNGSILVTGGHVDLPDGNAVRLGADDDFDVWFDGAGTAPADELVVTADPTGTAPVDAIRVAKSGGVTLPSAGLTVAGGGIDATGGPVSLPDDGPIRFGTNDDWEWVYDATNGRLELTNDPTGTAPIDLLRITDTGIFLPSRDLYLNSGNLRRAEAIYFDGDAPQDSLYATGSDIRVNSQSTTTDIIWFRESGVVEVPSGHLKLPADGNELRFGADEDFGWWYDGAGTAPADELVLTDDPTGTAPTDRVRVGKGTPWKFVGGDVVLSTATEASQRVWIGGENEWSLATQSDGDLEIVYDPNGTSPGTAPVFHTSGDVTYFNKARYKGVLVAEMGYELLSGASSTERYGLRYKSGTDDLMLTNREGGGDLFLSVNDGTSGTDVDAIHIPSGTSPTVNVQNDLTANGGEPVDRQANAHIPTSEIPDTDHAEIPVHIPAGQTLEVWVWGCRDDTQSTPVGLTVELFDETGAVSVASANTAHATGAPIASLAGGTAGKDATLRLDNATGGPINAGAKFGYTVS